MNYNNYFKNHGGYNYGDINSLTKVSKYLLANFPLLKKDLSKKKVLDIGCGLGNFTNFCKFKGVSNYTGIDLDKSCIDELSYIHKDFVFKFGDFNLIDNELTKDYDIIFMSHVFEHIDLNNAIITSKKIYDLLNKGGYWLNIMPNAGFLFSNYLRYGDITHKILYTNNSFNQILLGSGFERKNILHKNDILGQGFLSRLLFNFIWKFFYKLFVLMIFPQIKIYTPTIISIIKK